MPTPQEAADRATIGLLVHVTRELVSLVGGIVATASFHSDALKQDFADSMDELLPLMERVAEKYPPPDPRLN